MRILKDMQEMEFFHKCSNCKSEFIYTGMDIRRDPQRISSTLSTYLECPCCKERQHFFNFEKYETPFLDKLKEFFKWN